MRLRITAPVEIDGQWAQTGDVIDVTEPGLASRLLHYGQATEVEPDTTDEEATVATREPEEAYQ